MRQKVKLSVFGSFLFFNLILANCVNFRENKSEVSVVNSINVIRILQAQYHSKYQGQYALTFDELIKAVHLSDEFKGENPVVNRYVFTMTVQKSSATQTAFYSISARPQIAEGIQATGTRSFYSDSTIGSIRFTEEKRQATKDDPSI